MSGYPLVMSVWVRVCVCVCVWVCEWVWVWVCVCVREGLTTTVDRPVVTRLIAT